MSNNDKFERMINMKKTVLTTLSAVLLAGLVGCSSGAETNKNSTPSGESNQNQTEQVTENNESNETGMTQVTEVYGKVKKVVGNEIQLSVAKNPYENTEGESDSDNETSEGVPAEMADAIQFAPGTDQAIIDAYGHKEGVIAASKGMDLEYTGEEQSYTIPTGVSVMNEVTLAEGSMNDIKEGSVIALSISGTGNSQKIEMINILE